MAEPPDLEALDLERVRGAYGQGRNRVITAADLRRFWAKVNRTNTCWLWTGSIDTEGYATFWGRVTTHAHRFAYLVFCGPIAAGAQIDHLCRIRHCVNPDHLEAVSPRENTLRSDAAPAVNAKKTHCPSGHEYDLLNTYVDRRGHRYCRACNAARARARAKSTLAPVPGEEGKG